MTTHDRPSQAEIEALHRKLQERGDHDAALLVSRLELWIEWLKGQLISMISSKDWLDEQQKRRKEADATRWRETD